MTIEQPEIYWNKTTGKNEVTVPFMSMKVMKELFKELQHPGISKDEAVAKIWLSDIDEKEKIIVAVNIGEFKERTKRSRWIYLKCMNVVRILKSYTKTK